MEQFNLSVETRTTGLPEGASKLKGMSLAIGFFDGVHLGHLEVIRQAVELAKQHHLVPAIMTFSPHPRVVLGQGSHYETVLTPLEDKLTLFSELGIEAAYVVRFDRAFSEVTAEQFFHTFIAPLGVKTTVVGFDFSFGHRGEGNANTLRILGGGDIQVHIVPPVYLNGEKVSSTRIRDRLAEGKSTEANQLLGRPYAMQGIVVHGQARGRQLGFPTANIFPEQSYVIPSTGVYVIQADILTESGESQQRCQGVLNVGYRPTFELPGGQLSLEAHLFDFDGDLYGRKLKLMLHSFLRQEMKFSSIEQLTSQIHRDAATARDWFTASNNCHFT